MLCTLPGLCQVEPDAFGVPQSGGTPPLAHPHGPRGAVGLDVGVALSACQCDQLLANSQILLPSFARPASSNVGKWFSSIRLLACEDQIAYFFVVILFYKQFTDVSAICSSITDTATPAGPQRANSFQI